MEESRRSGRQPFARRRTLAMVAAVIALAIAAVVIAINDSAGSSRGVDPVLTAETRRIDALLAGIPRTATTLGDRNAPVTLQYFGDMVCPPTREFTLVTMALILREWVRPGELRIEYRSMHEGTEPEGVFVHQQDAALAAGLQGKLWYFLEYYYEEQARHQVNENDSCFVPESLALLVARQVPGLNLARWMTNRYDQALSREVLADAHTARSADFEYAPSFLLGRTGARPTTKLYFEWADHAPFERRLDQGIERLLSRQAQ
jgi:hypothetical protein